MNAVKEENLPGFVARLRLIPWSATKAQIIKYFGNIDFPLGANGIHFIVEKQIGKPNDAFVVLGSREDFMKTEHYKNDDLKMEGMFQLKS